MNLMGNERNRELRREALEFQRRVWSLAARIMTVIALTVLLIWLAGR